MAGSPWRLIAVFALQIALFRGMRAAAAGRQRQAAGLGRRDRGRQYRDRHLRPVPRDGGAEGDRRRLRRRGSWRCCCSPPYAALVWYACRFPELELDDPNSPILKLPEVGPTVKSGLQLPAADRRPGLVPDDRSGCRRRCRRSGRPAFHAPDPLDPAPADRPVPRSGRLMGRRPSRAGRSCVDALVTGARNMIGIGIATATAGIVGRHRDADRHRPRHGGVRRVPVGAATCS